MGQGRWLGEQGIVEPNSWSGPELCQLTYHRALRNLIYTARVPCAIEDGAPGACVDHEWDKRHEIRSSCYDAPLAQKKAIGFSGDPVPPGTGSGPALTWNSQRFSRFAVS